ncbi:hypothetical protein AJ80_02179 [Polytolypa hystricis UAMH7299]|uniref:PHD and RING finger domain-containing protein n=1 Tax=Polytolypa hystricis (strain UAMH7299) TaxID=1447883 RepID=A0A2B7YRS6_POLH7|nr:hypothetical protein AJ80_02179 [Polytolypa hystricis UAMH7299]
MTDTCIVCLGDLGDGASDPPPITVDLEVPRLLDGEAAADKGDVSPTKESDDNDSKIAHLLPCGHDLHNECLKPWVERANSCPICRQKFNIVELLEKVGGPAVSSYDVDDRVQVAELDLSMIIDEVDDDSDSQPCPVCGDDGNEDLLLLCDGCDAVSHTFCVGLDAVPSGPWFCDQCEVQRPITLEPSRPHTRPGRRTRGDQRRNRSRNQVNALHWARVWQSVWDHLNLDLDFPFDDDLAADRLLQQQRREAANRRDFQAWERRFQVAQRQGAANRFRDTAAALLDMRNWPSRPRPRIETPEPESLDEVRAWNAFERAREIEDVPGPNRRKRKSPTASPAEPEAVEPERKLKRPRTRRAEQLADLLENRGESSKTGRLTNASADGSTAPSFLQSLLKEVEESSAPGVCNGTYRSSILAQTPTDPSSPRPSSPAQSALSSNRSSPRPGSTTPPPHSNGPATPISSIHDPVYSSPEFSPTFSPNQDSDSAEQTRSSRQRHRVHPAAHSSSSSPSRSRSNESSPTRPGLSLSAKSDLQRMVRTALKPHYRNHIVSKDEYTDINRRISRMLYDRVGEAFALDAHGKSKWEVVANEEVDKAIAMLKEQKLNGASESGGGGITI